MRTVGVMIIALAAAWVSYAQDIIMEEDSSNLNEPMVYIRDLKRIQPAFKESGPKDNTIEYSYDETFTYKVRCRTAMDTQIILPKGEVIAFQKFGEDKNFRFTPIRDENGMNTHMGYIEVRFAGADTNLTLIGESGNIYNFYVRVDDHKSSQLPHFKVFIKDPRFKEKLLELKKPVAKAEQPKTDPVKNSLKRPEFKTDEEIGDYLRMIDTLPMRKLYTNQNLDFRYVIYLRKNLIAPMAVFDDGYWTYFRMSSRDNLDKVKDLPVVYEVTEGIEQMVNTRVVNNYIIAETLADTWAMRIGNRFLCIEKDERSEKVF